MNILLQTYYTNLGNDTYDRVDIFFDTLTLTTYQELSQITTAPGTPEPDPYSRDTAERFHYTCSGTTETGYYHNGEGGFTTTTVTDSTTCGYVPTADGTFIRNQCYGFDLYQVVHDGNGGERQGNLVEANSKTCGYVAPVLGCTDPTADNYNPDATPGNADENVCTYTPGVLSEVKVIEVRSCPSDGVHVQWFNSLGGIDGWMFQGKVDTLFASEPTSEYSYQNGLRSSAGKVLTPSIVVNTSELNKNRFETICGMFASPLVWLNIHGDKKRVYVEPASDLGQRNIGQTSYSLQVRVSLQPLNALKN